MSTVPDTWFTRDLPVLRAAVRGADSGIEFEEIAAETGFDLRTVSMSLRALQDAGYVEAYFAGGFSGFIRGARERGRRETGAWPSPESLTDRLAEALAAAAEAEPEPERKTLLRSAAQGLAGAGRTVAVELFTAYLRREVGLP